MLRRAPVKKLSSQMTFAPSANKAREEASRESRRSGNEHACFEVHRRHIILSYVIGEPKAARIASAAAGRRRRAAAGKPGTRRAAAGRHGGRGLLRKMGVDAGL